MICPDLLHFAVLILNPSLNKVMTFIMMTSLPLLKGLYERVMFLLEMFGLSIVFVHSIYLHGFPWIVTVIFSYVFLTTRHPLLRRPHGGTVSPLSELKSGDTYFYSSIKTKLSVAISEGQQRLCVSHHFSTPV